MPQAFHGIDEVVTPVLTRELDREEEAHLRLHAACFTPCAAEETVPGVMSGYRHASLLTMLPVAAYAAPGVFEEGLALTTQESIPPFALYIIVVEHICVERVPRRQWHTVRRGPDCGPTGQVCFSLPGLY